MMFFNKPVKLHVQITNHELVIIAAPDKGDPGEEDALQAVGYLSQILENKGVTCRRFERNTPTGNRIDMISIIR